MLSTKFWSSEDEEGGRLIYFNCRRPPQRTGTSAAATGPPVSTSSSRLKLNLTLSDNSTDQTIDDGRNTRHKAAILHRLSNLRVWSIHAHPHVRVLLVGRRPRRPRGRHLRQSLRALGKIVDIVHAQQTEADVFPSIGLFT